MSFPWIDSLTVAEALIQARNTVAPAEARVAISRAYYAAYCAARNHARDTESYVPVPTGRDHGFVAEYYLAGISRAHRQIGQTLQRLLLERHRADYDDDMPHNPCSPRFPSHRLRCTPVTQSGQRAMGARSTASSACRALRRGARASIRCLPRRFVPR